MFYAHRNQKCNGNNCWLEHSVIRTRRGWGPASCVAPSHCMKSSLSWWCQWTFHLARNSFDLLGFSKEVWLLVCLGVSNKTDKTDIKGHYHHRIQLDITHTAHWCPLFTLIRGSRGQRWWTEDGEEEEGTWYDCHCHRYTKLDIYTIYTVDIYTVDIYSVVSQLHSYGTRTQCWHFRDKTEASSQQVDWEGRRQHRYAEM